MGAKECITRPICKQIGRSVKVHLTLHSNY